MQAALQQVHELQKYSKAGLMELDRLRQTKDAHTMQLTQVSQELVHFTDVLMCISICVPIRGLAWLFACTAHQHAGSSSVVTKS